MRDQPPTTRKPYTVIAKRHAGTHLIIPIVRRLTGKTVYSPKGDTALLCIPSESVIVWTRDPRNWVVSLTKWKHRFDPMLHDPSFNRDAAVAAVIGDVKNGITHIDHLRAWAKRWIKWPGALRARFEDMQDRSQGIRETERIALFLGAENDAEAVYDSVFGQSGTYTGKPSNWLDWFGPKSIAAWEASRGPEVMKGMGYE